MIRVRFVVGLALRKQGAPRRTIKTGWKAGPTAYSLQPTAHSLQPTAHSLQLTAYSPQP